MRFLPYSKGWPGRSTNREMILKEVKFGVWVFCPTQYFHLKDWGWSLSESQSRQSLFKFNQIILMLKPKQAATVSHYTLITWLKQWCWLWESKGLLTALKIDIEGILTYFYMWWVRGENVLNVEGVTRREDPTENNHSVLQLLSALRSVLTSFSSMFWFYGW